jgi:hypothetical protein
MLRRGALLRHSGEIMNEPKRPIDPLLLKALVYMDHDPDRCSMRTWSDPGDNFKTSFGVTIESDECDCGMIALALEIEHRFFGNAAIPHQHREQFGSPNDTEGKADA